MNILLTGAYKYTNEQKLKIKQLGFKITYVQNELEELKIDPSIFDVVICNSLFMYNDIEKFSRLKLIQLTSAGFDRVPLDYINKKRIKLYNAESTYSIPMAEFVMAVILKIYKKTDFFYINQKDRKWIKNRDIIELAKQKALIMGFGNVGSEIAKRLKSFDIEISVYDIRDICSNYVDFAIKDYNPILSDIDIIIIALPLSDKTKHLVNKEFIQKIKDGAVLINISRGGIIKESDLINALEKNKFLGVSLDVFEEEPLSINSKLWDFENVHITPHNSFVSNRNNDRLFKIILNNLSKVQVN